MIDPGLEWSTFLGGSGSDPIGGARAARDGTGDVFVATWSNSQDFVSPDGTIPGYNNSAGVVRLNATGTAMVYATFIGGWHSQLLYRALVTNTAEITGARRFSIGSEVVLRTPGNKRGVVVEAGGNGRCRVHVEGSPQPAATTTRRRRQRPGRNRRSHEAAHVADLTPLLLQSPRRRPIGRLVST